MFSRHFFRRFGICSLHLISLGLIKLSADLIGRLNDAYTNDLSPAKYRREVNAAMDKLKAPHLTSISWDIYKKEKSEQ